MATAATSTASVDKWKVAARLQELTVVDGVLPTRVQHSERLTKAADQLRRRDLPPAVAAISAFVRETVQDGSTEPATDLFTGSRELREQLAAFAASGISFYYAGEEMLGMAPVDRALRGGNPEVSRVLMHGERLFLETSRLVVRFAPGVAADEQTAILARHDIVPLQAAGLPPGTLRGLCERRWAVEASLALMSETAVLHAAPDLIEQLGPRFDPGDAEYQNQWHHQVLDCPTAWETTRGDRINVAVIDNGFDLAHADLRTRFGDMTGWFRPTPDFADADFILGSGGFPDQNHGTACAGMIAGRDDAHNKGGCGVAFEARLQMVACAPDQIGTQSTLARAIAYAARASLEDSAAQTPGADIICCSLGPNSATWLMQPVLSDAIDFAASSGRGGKGCAIFWACTNGNFPISADEVCSHPSVIAVGRSRHNDLDDGSGFGPKLEFLAPGVDVWIPQSGRGLHVTTGTSFAAPCAAGVAALALAENPALTAADLRQVMRDSCVKVGPIPYINGHNIRFGHGRINAASAVASARAAAPSP